MKERYVDIGSGIFLCLLAFFLMQQLAGVPREGVLLPRVVLIAMAACGALMSVLAFMYHGDGRMHFFEGLNVTHFVAIVALFLLSVYCCLYFSFFTTVFCMCFVVTTLLAEARDARTLVGNAAFSLATIALIYLFFTKLMRVQFPEVLFL